MAPAAASRPGRTSALALLLVLGTFLLFAQVRHHEFISFDDPGYVTQNRQIRGGLTLDGIAWAFTSGQQGNWHPLTWLSHMLDAELFGLSPGAHHLSSVALHAANTLLLFVVLQLATGRPWRSAMVAALFAAHPLHVESVAWAAERKDVLSTLFWLLTTWAYLGYVRRPGAARYLGVLVLYTLGLMAKPMLVSLPLALLLLDFWPLGRLTDASRPFPRWPADRSVWIGLVLEKLPLLALAAASSAVTFLVQRSGGAVKPLEVFPLPSRLANALVAYSTYLRQTFVPSDLAFFYPYPESFSSVAVVGALLVLLVLSGAALFYARRVPYLFTGWFWFAVTLVPVIGLVQVGSQSHADRYTYVPLIGLFVLLVWGWADLTEKLSFRVVLSAAVAATVLAACGWLTHVQLGFWRGSVALYERALAVTSDNYLAHDTLGVALAQVGEVDRARSHYEEALRIKPEFVTTHNNLGVLLSAQGELGQAIQHYEEALRLDPDQAQAHNNLGIALASRGDAAKAMTHFSRALELNPENPDAHRNLGIVLASQGDRRRALDHYREALRQSEGDPELALTIAWMLATDEDPTIRNGTEALELALSVRADGDGADPRTLDTLAAAYAELDRFDDAVRAAEEAIELATNSGQTALAAIISRRLELYRSGRPFRAPAVR